MATRILAIARSIGYNVPVAIKRAKLTDQIRQAVDVSGMSRYRICKLLNITESSMSRFMGGGGLRIQQIDALAELLGLDIVSNKRRTSKKSR